MDEKEREAMALKALDNLTKGAECAVSETSGTIDEDTRQVRFDRAIVIAYIESLKQIEY